VATVLSGGARREAVQPSLWDRLVDDLPGLVAETNAREHELGLEIGVDRLQRLIAGGRRAIEQEADLDDRQRRDAFALLSQVERRNFLEERGIVVTPEVLREAVRRDIEGLFGIERLQARFLFSDLERAGREDPQDVIADFPHVKRSVLNFGVPSFSGRRAKDFDVEALERELREVIAVFEPRLKRDTIRVTVDTDDTAGLRIRIEGLLLLSPVPERLRLSTMIDLDNGRAATMIEEA
jgi:type VI secretion system protein ImpF